MIVSSITQKPFLILLEEFASNRMPIRKYDEDDTMKRPLKFRVIQPSCSISLDQKCILLI